MTSLEYQRAVGVFASREGTESALQKLKDHRFPMEKVSVLAQETTQDNRIAGVEVIERAGDDEVEGITTGAAAGGALGTITGLLAGLGTLAVAGVGSVMLAGAAATLLTTTAASGAIGAATGGLVGLLIDLGIPPERAQIYNDLVAQGYYFVIVDGSEKEICQAREILGSQGIQEWNVFIIQTHA